MKKNLLLRMGALTPAVPALGLAQDVSTTAPIPAPGLRYGSAFAGCKVCEKLAPAGWRAANDGVGQATRSWDGHGTVMPLLLVFQGLQQQPANQQFRAGNPLVPS